MSAGLLSVLGQTLSDIFLEPVKITTDRLLTDRLRLWRWKNRITIAEEAGRILQARGFSPDQFKEVPIGDIIRLSEAAEAEDQPELQQRWSQLLANALDPTSKTDARRVYTDLLRQMSAAEITFLELLRLKSSSAIDHPMLPVLRERWLELAPEERWLVVQNLQRLQCIAYSPGFINTDRAFIRSVDNPLGFTMNAPSYVDQTEFVWILTQLQLNSNVASGLSKSVRHERQNAQGPDADKLSEAEALLGNFSTTVLGSSLVAACGEQPTTTGSP